MCPRRYLKSLLFLLLIVSRCSLSEGNIAMDEEHSQVNNINDPLYDYQGIDLEDKTVVVKSVLDAPYKESSIVGKHDCPPGYESYPGAGGSRCVQIVSGGAIVSPELVEELVKDYYRNKTHTQPGTGQIPLDNITITPTTSTPTPSSGIREVVAEILITTPKPGNQSTYIKPSNKNQSEGTVSAVELDRPPELQEEKYPSAQETNDPTIVHNFGDTIYDFFSGFYSGSDNES
ncbi:unnamed protein product [Allacma fusca]|uniref:Uncharacterized protein n=1 Tax=Allacma fusca TaxID=39272 RepID=A0A8J2KCL3_9HEXA|nr:unnamed protein product [Allacma fusca]